MLDQMFLEVPSNLVFCDLYKPSGFIYILAIAKVVQQLKSHEGFTLS